jgi:phage FluMu protein Com
VPGDFKYVILSKCMDVILQEYRCQHCRKLLFKGVLVEAEVQVLCRSCKDVTTINKSQFNQLLCMIENCPNRIHCPVAQNR